MAVTRLSDIIEPTEFTNYIVQNTMEKTALVTSGVMVLNGVIQDQLAAGAHSFSIPFWLDLGNEEANVVNDDPTNNSTPNKLQSGKQLVRKSFLHNSWSAMNLASEISGDNALVRIQNRVSSYWQRQMQRRLISSLKGIMADNIANDSGDMVHDITALTGAAANFSASAVIDTANTMGDSLTDVTAIAMHSSVYSYALKNDLVDTIPDSQGGTIQTFRGLVIIVDDSLPFDSGDYTTVLFGSGAVGYGFGAPRVAEGTEIENLPSAGNGGGQQILHSRNNLAIHPSGFSWIETSVAGDSPTIAELGVTGNWNRIVERKAIPMAFLISKIG